MAQLEGFKQLQADVKAEFDKLDGQIKDYDSLLKEQPLDKVCSFIERNAALYLKISDARKKISSLDSAIDVLKINIGEVDLNQAITEFLEQKQNLLQEFTDLNTKGQMLESNCNQYEEYASDKEEKEIIGTTQLQIGSFLKTVSVK